MIEDILIDSESSIWILMRLSYRWVLICKMNANIYTYEIFPYYFIKFHTVYIVQVTSMFVRHHLIFTSVLAFTVHVLFIKRFLQIAKKQCVCRLWYIIEKWSIVTYLHPFETHKRHPVYIKRVLDYFNKLLLMLLLIISPLHIG